MTENNKTPLPSERDVTLWPVIGSPVPPSPELEARVREILDGLTLEQKVAQVIQPEIRDITVEDMRRYGFGSYLNGGGAFPGNNKHSTPEDWVALAEQMYQASIDTSLDGSAIPTMWGTDAVHGHNNVIGATLFPHNIGLGATRNPALLEQIAHATAKEVMATGIDWIFAPTVAVARDDRWGRTYESYSEDPRVVKDYAAAIVRGLQGSVESDFLGETRVLSTVKHFIGDGGTLKGDDQGDNLSSEAELISIHAQGYVGGLAAGAQSVMASFNSWHGEKVHGSRYLLTDVLKQRMGFDGFIVGDWNGHGQIPDCSNENCAAAMNAGLDIYMVPTQAWKPLMENLILQVKSGVIPQSRLDDAVSRILRVKLRAGLFDKPSPANRPLSGQRALIGHPSHRAIARQAVRESLVLLKNAQQLLPLSPSSHVLVTGDGADNIGKQSGGWTITWQGTGNDNDDFPGGTSIYEGLRQQIEDAGGTITLSQDGSFSDSPDVAVVVFGEEPYAEGHGDLDNLEYQRGNKRDLALLKSLQAKGIPTVSIFLSGRPLWVNPELNASDAFVAAWLPGSEGAGIADVILRDKHNAIQHDFTGTLPFSWPATPGDSPLNFDNTSHNPLLSLGHGLRYGDGDVLSLSLSEDNLSQFTELATVVPLYSGKVAAPWRWAAASAGEIHDMTSNTLSVNGLSVRTTDRDVQEDALQITWDGETQTAFGLIASFPEDWLRYQEKRMALVFDYLLPEQSQAMLTLDMQCVGQCAGTQALTLNGAQAWQSKHLPLSCFTEQGMQFGKVLSPFMLSSRRPLTLSISNIRLVPEDASQDCSHREH